MKTLFAVGGFLLAFFLSIFFIWFGGVSFEDMLSRDVNSAVGLGLIMVLSCYGGAGGLLFYNYKYRRS